MLFFSNFVMRFKTNSFGFLVVISGGSLSSFVGHVSTLNMIFGFSESRIGEFLTLWFRLSFLVILWHGFDIWLELKITAVFCLKMFSLIYIVKWMRVSLGDFSRCGVLFVRQKF
jgi:hypothetical protein